MRIVATISILIFTSFASTQADDSLERIGPIFQQHCVSCHGGQEEAEGDVDLAKLQSTDAFAEDPDLIEDMIEAIDSGAMPPDEAGSLSETDRKTLLTELRKILIAAVASNSRPPQTPIRRMNRFQYSNAVRDLFELNRPIYSLPERMLREYNNYFDPGSGKMPNKVFAGSRPLGKSQMIEPRLYGVVPFPQDLRAEHGFDNRGDHLSMSPLLMESFLKLSRSIVDSPDFSPKNVGIWSRFFAPPNKERNKQEVVRLRIRKLLTRAFRQPVTEEILQRYVTHAMASMESGESFTNTMKSIASAAIASPKFLYLFDRTGNTDSIEALDDYEIASRLSFFLWGSIPDPTLLKLAAQGQLTSPAILDEQIDRMLNDRKLKRFCDSFPSQWLQLERIISSSPELKNNRNFYFTKYKASMHMMLEPLLLFETILVEDRPILELIDSKFSYRSNLLIAWYAGKNQPKGIKPTKIQFKRVPISDRRQGGVITNAAVMTMTSNPTRTQPITRGAWMLTTIFNNPPEPPPADVPALPEDETSENEHQTIREIFSEHRKRADCASCHTKIDPLGFALENYGPTGLWRDQYINGRTVEADGILFRKHEFNNVIEFKDAILSEKDKFTRAFAKHLLAFALGREVVAADTIALDKIAAQAAESEYRIRPLIKLVIMSQPFLQKHNPSTN